MKYKHLKNLFSFSFLFAIILEFTFTWFLYFVSNLWFYFILLFIIYLFIFFGGSDLMSLYGVSYIVQSPAWAPTPDGGHSRVSQTRLCTGAPVIYDFKLSVICRNRANLYNQSPLITIMLCFLTFYFILKYSQLTTLWYFQVNSTGTQPYIYTHPFFPKLPSHPGSNIILSRVPSVITCF